MASLIRGLLPASAGLPTSAKSSDDTAADLVPPRHDGTAIRRPLSLMDLPPEIHLLISDRLIYPDALSLRHVNRHFYFLVDTGIKLKIDWLVERRRLHLECPNNQRCDLGSDLRFCRGSVRYVQLTLLFFLLLFVVDGMADRSDCQTADGEAEGAHGVRVAARAGLSHLRHQHVSAAEEAGSQTQALAAHPAYVRDVVGAADACTDCGMLGMEGGIGCLTDDV